MKIKKADVIIFGAGPAGLASASRLVKKGKKVIIFEKDSQVGGISKTVKFKGYRFDLGGHRFFTKSSEVDNLWTETLGGDFLTRSRLSRIYYRGKFFHYPLKLFNVLSGLGIFTSLAVLLSYLASRAFPYKEERTFEQWISNRFGKKLYNIFFKTYTEKLWGIPCNQIQAEWAVQRIRGLSFVSAVKNALFPNNRGAIKTLVDKFKYPKYGPGMMYEKIADNIRALGSVLKLESEIIKINYTNNKITEVIARNKTGGKTGYFADHFISSMPITELISCLSPSLPQEALKAAQNLKYRSFIAINIVLNYKDCFPDTWIYIHSPEVKMGRVQNFKNWSPHMIADQNKTALGLEYFCAEGGELWKMKNEDLINLGLRELEKLKLGRKTDFLDGFVSRVPKAYPVYDSTYLENVKTIRRYLDQFSNLQPVGRYGMFKYNNMDHSILTGLKAAENILGASHNLWAINCDDDYHEEIR